MHDTLAESFLPADHEVRVISIMFAFNVWLRIENQTHAEIPVAYL